MATVAESDIAEIKSLIQQSHKTQLAAAQAIHGNGAVLALAVSISFGIASETKAMTGLNPLGLAAMLFLLISLYKVSRAQNFGVQNRLDKGSVGSETR